MKFEIIKHPTEWMVPYYVYEVISKGIYKPYVGSASTLWGARRIARKHAKKFTTQKPIVIEEFEL